MNTLRQSAPSAEQISNANVADVGPQERRLHMQAYRLWLDLHRGGGLPDAREILAHEDCHFASKALLVKVEPDGSTQLTAVGPDLPALDFDLPAPLDAVPGRSLLSRVTEHALQPIANRVPIGFEADFTDHNGQEIAYRAIALPCAQDGVEIDTVLGVISFSEAGAKASRDAAAKVLEEPNPKIKPERTNSAKPPKTNPTNLDVPSRTDEQIRSITMSYKAKLEEAMTIDGALAVALVDYSSGMALATLGNAKGLDLEVAAAGNSNVIKAKYETMKDLGLNEPLEDMLITLDTQIHMIRPVTSESGKGLFIYLALDKAKANLAMARHKLRNIEKGLEV